MASTKLTLLLGIITQTSYVSALDLRFMPDPPTLNIQGVHRINKTENLELICSGRQYVKWSIPNVASRLSISDCSGSGLFCSSVLITNATANETGSYQCYYKDLKAEEGKTSASVYVFVHDYKTPFVPSEKDYEVVFIREGVKVIIPCRGSVENLNVTLHTYPNKELYPDGKDSLWDAQKGFTVPSHLVSYAGVVFCQTRIANETFKSPLYIVAVVGYKIYNLTLSPAQLRLSVGERLVLNCSASTELNVGIEFNWTHSGHALTSENASKLVHTTPHKKKLWNSLELSNTLTVENVSVEHSGDYTCSASSGLMEKTATASLTVYEKPFIDMKGPWTSVWEVNVGDKTPIVIPIKYTAYPEPNFKWFKNGLLLKEDYRIKQKSDALVIREVKEMDAGNYTMILTNKITKEERRRAFQLMVNENNELSEDKESGGECVYRCVAANKAGEDSRVIFFHVTRGLELSVSPPDELLKEDDILLRCKADRLIYGNLAWFRVLNISDLDSVASAQPCRSLVLQQVPRSHTVLSQTRDSNMSLELLLPQASAQDEGVYACQCRTTRPGRRLACCDGSRSEGNMSTTVIFTCDAAGTPKPTVIWTKNNLTVVEGSGVIQSQDNNILTIQRVKKEDSGLYTCTACNSRGCDIAQAFLSTEGVEEKTNVELIVPIGSVVIAMFFWLLIVFVIVAESGRTTGTRCIRSGREAAAFGIEKATTCTTVAVKMLKEGATASEYRALMSELKILIHIGHHLNVVNLLGACTKPGGPLMVIVEYCKHGNLSSYLKSKRGEYSPYKRKRVHSQRWTRSEEDMTEGDLGLGKIAQLDICTGTAVCSIGERASNNTMDSPQGMKATCFCFILTLSSSVITRVTYVITESSDDDHLTMEDLISYSFQVAKGMEFLSSRKCIHRDLAARNILLSENNVVKICDFGLARDVYKDPDYVRKGDARLPLKWMAPETIFDRVYTTQSDVWSFGVLLWEIFSLGASPYPGVCIDESFCRRLKEGTRMRPPEYATTEIYQTMLDCWLDCPTDRPTFAELVEHLGNLLEASAQQDGKDYIPVTESCPLTSDPRSLYSSPQSGESLASQHYDHPLSIASVVSQDSERCNLRTFEDIPVEHSSVMEGHLDCSLGFSPEEVKSLDPQLSATPNLSQLLRCKSKESLGSESSNQTSGYQSGYHSDDAEMPIYANEEVILKHHKMKKPPRPRAMEKYHPEIRYSTPPV
ncbi:hypothetical protein WMY93_025166 [Mugilogobius chulae]|uniref:receptor protein-tyrosine kinase n=1 Tax=Mugilogobius chulae TaxID=88201 RepID=A0AAW0N8I0_9GOBI